METGTKIDKTQNEIINTESVAIQNVVTDTKSDAIQNVTTDTKSDVIQNAITDTELNSKKYQSEGKPVEHWKNIINKLKESGRVMLYTNLINTDGVEINDMTIGIEFKNGLTAFGKTIIESPENIKELERLVSLEYSKEMRIKLLDKDNKKTTGKNDTESLINELDLPVNIIEE